MNDNTKVPKTDEEWKKILTPKQYEIMRQKGTETPFSGEYVQTKDHGMYTCAGCGQQLFASDAKFDSGTGWPSFDQALSGSVTFQDDTDHGMKRVEVTCAKCGAHLGHVFDDGPASTGKRFCINSACLMLQKYQAK